MWYIMYTNRIITEKKTKDDFLTGKIPDEYV